MSKKYVFIFVLLVHSVLSDDCVRYYFDDYYNSFTTDIPACNGQALWSQGTYANELSITAPHENSEFFISPSNTLSCTGSFTFTMMPGALVEFKVYVERGTALTFIMRLIQVQGTDHINVGDLSLGDDVEDGWHVIYLGNILVGDTPFEGLITFLGFASDDSVLIVDSFRSIPLTMDPEEECILYESNEDDGDGGDENVPITPTTTPTIETTPTTDAIETTTANSSGEDTTSPTPTDSESFWTPLTITLITLACFVVLVIVAAISYYLGSLVAKKKIKEVEDRDVDYDVPQILPRVRAYPDYNSNKYNGQP